MLPQECRRELNTCWLPNITDSGLDRLIELLEKDSPLLIHGSFSRAFPMGCLATHIAWHHPATAAMTVEAGVQWLSRVAGLNPVSSHVIREWDRAQECSWEIRQELLSTLKEHRDARRQPQRETPRFRVPQLQES